MPIPLETFIDEIRIAPGNRFRVRDHDTDWSARRELREFEADELKARARAMVEENLEALAEVQERLYGNRTYSLLVIFQAMDAAGKDGMVKHVMSGLNPQGCQVASFKRPSEEELDHNFLWRYSKALPERGRIGIFNRSYYEETLVVRVHPELVERQRLPGVRPGRRFWEERFEDINAFERHLVRNGTVILKFFLNVSRSEQKRRLLERLDIPGKQWKFDPADVDERALWKEYMKAYEETIRATSTRFAPWHVIPADHKWVARAMVSAVIADAVDRLDLRVPEVPPEKRRALAAARRRLVSEEA